MYVIKLMYVVIKDFLYLNENYYLYYLKILSLHDSIVSIFYYIFYLHNVT